VRCHSCDALHALTLTCETDSAANWLSAPWCWESSMAGAVAPAPPGRPSLLFPRCFPSRSRGNSLSRKAAWLLDFLGVGERGRINQE